MIGLRLRAAMLAVAHLALAAPACAGPAHEPPPYHLQAPLAEVERTKVLILGTDHLRALGKDFDARLLDQLLRRLERFEPDAIAVESLPPEEIDRLTVAAGAQPEGTAAKLLEAFAEDASRWGIEAQGALRLSHESAQARADSLLAKTSPRDAETRRSLALLLLGAYDLPSALVQWSYLPDSLRRAGGDPMTPDVAEFLGRRLRDPNEVVTIGVALAHRRGLERIYSIDDHLDDEVGLSTGLNERLGRELVDNPAYTRLAASRYFSDAQNRLPDAARQGDLLPLYVRVNSPASLNDDVAHQWHLFFRTRLASHLDRERAGLWEARNLNIAARIRTMAAFYPGRRILVVIGSAHKPFLDRYLSQMMDVEVVQLADVTDRSGNADSGH